MLSSVHANLQNYFVTPEYSKKRSEGGGENVRADAASNEDCGFPKSLRVSILLGQLNMY